MAEHALLQSVGDHILRARQAAGVEQQELAQRIGKTASYLSRIESGTAMPSLQLIADIADALELEREPLERLVLGAQVLKLVGSNLSLDELKRALSYLAAADSPLDRALSWTVGNTPQPHPVRRLEA